MNKNYLIDILVERKNKMEEAGLIPTLELLIEELQLEVELENQVKSETQHAD